MTDAPICPDCGTPLKPNPRRLGIRCKPCGARHMARSPDKREKCRAAMKRHFADPAYRAAHRKRTGDGTRRALEDPARLEELRERGRRCGLLRLGHNRHGAGSPERVAAGRKRSETLFAWCPPEYRGEYQRLVKTKLVRAPEARRMVEDMIAADLSRHAVTGQLQQSKRLAQMNPELELLT